MSLLKIATLAAVLSTSPAFSEDARDHDVVGAWQPVTADTGYADWTVLVFNGEGRFAALVAHGLETLDAAGGSWMLAEDRGELVLAFDNSQAEEAPGTTRYVQMLLLGSELRPYPGMAGRSPLAETAWRRVDGGYGEQASR